MPVEVSVDGTKIGIVGPDFQQFGIGEPPTAVITYLGDERGIVYISDIIRNTKPTQLLLENPGNAGGTDIMVRSQLWPDALAEVMLWLARE